MIRPDEKETLTLSLGELQLWLLEPQEVERFAEEGEAWLAVEERLRADIFPRAQQRQRYVGRRAALRRILGRYTGLAPQSLPLMVKASGKPYLAGDLAAPQFSVSASEGWTLIAVCDDQAVGVDVERFQAGLDSQAIASSFFDPVECLFLERAKPQEREQLFFRAWTRAEAWLKMTGKGLAGLEALATFSRPRQLWLRDLKVPEGFYGALCLAAAPTAVRWMAYPGLLQPGPAIEDPSLSLSPLQLLEA